MIYDKICFNRNWNKSSCSNKCKNYDKCYITSKIMKLSKKDMLITNVEKDKPD